MLPRFGNIIIIYMLVFLIACVEPYEPDLTHYDNVFVVDGEINNLPGSYEVRLTQSFNFEEDSGINIVGAQVKIIENTGLEVALQETQEGVYRTNSSFRARIGNSYKLHITYNGKVYETEFETLKAPIPIDNIYWEYENREHEGRDGLQLLLDTHNPSNSTHYYAWEYEETWKFYVPNFPHDKPEWEQCFKYSNSYDYKIGSSIHKTGDKIERYPLLFIDNNTNKLRWRYSILVKQFTLSEQAYQFFSNLIELNENQGTLFDPVPYSLTGNLRCVTDKDKPVLGYFLVSGVSEKRIFIDNDDLPFEYQPISGFESCIFQILFIDPGNLFSPVTDEISFLSNLICSSFDFNTLQAGDTVLTLGIQVFPRYYSVSPLSDIFYYPVVFFVDPILNSNCLQWGTTTSCCGFPTEDFTEFPIDTPTEGDTIIIPTDTIIMPLYSNWRYYPAVDSLMNLGFFVFDVDSSPKGFVLRFMNSPICFNCTLSGDNKVPDFWVEE